MSCQGSSHPLALLKLMDFLLLMAMCYAIGLATGCSHVVTNCFADCFAACKISFIRLRALHASTIFFAASARKQRSCGRSTWPLASGCASVTAAVKV
jgi:hypothetical protein